MRSARLPLIVLAVWFTTPSLIALSAEPEDEFLACVRSMVAMGKKVFLNGDEVHKLDRERFLAAISALEERQKEFLNGRGTLDPMAVSGESVCNAGMDVLEDRKDKLALLESYVTMMRVMEKIAIARLEAGKVQPAEKFDAQYARATAEARLARFKRDTPGKK